MIVEPGDPRAPGPSALLRAGRDLMRATYPADSDHSLSPDQLGAPGVAFLVARDGGAVLGCGALADRGGYGEVKSMFVDPSARGRGIGAAVLDAIEALSRSRGHRCLRLETGPELEAALRLYRRRGFVERGPFGAYAPDPFSLFMEKPLA